MPDKEKTKLVATSTEKRKADDIEIKDLKKVNEENIKKRTHTKQYKETISSFTFLHIYISHTTTPNAIFSAFFSLSI